MQLSERHHQYWRANLRITGILLAIWFFVTFVIGFFARDLNFSFFGWPFSFWVAALGALIGFVGMSGFLGRYLYRVEQRLGVAVEAGPGWRTAACSRRCRH